MRSFARSPEREEHVIRQRFPVYAGLPARKVETMRPLTAVVTELLSVLPARAAFVSDR
jgi:shikimate kinase